jgi:hypothetical protein
MLTGYIRQCDGEAALRQQLAALFPRNFAHGDLPSRGFD